MSTSITLLDRKFSANDVDIMVFERVPYFFPLGGPIKKHGSIWTILQHALLSTCSLSVYSFHTYHTYIHHVFIMKRTECC